MKLTILSKDPSEFRSSFGRIEETIICFRDLLTFSRHSSLQDLYILTFVCKRVATCLQIFNHLPTFLQVSELQAQLEQPEPS